MENVKVSVIVPVYNAQKYLERCVNSLLNQTMKEIEIILVDDESKDESPAMCDCFAQKDARIKVIHKENEGAGMARNAGLKTAVGKYIAFADCDDFVEPMMYEKMYMTAEKYASSLVISGVIFVDGSVFKSEGERTVKEYFEDDTQIEGADAIKELRLGIVGAMPEDSEDSKYGMSVWKNLFRRDIIENNGLRFESEREMLSEDALFMVDYIGCIERATGINGAFYNYCRNEGSISKSYKKDRFYKYNVFLKEAEKRYKKDIDKEEYQLYIDRFSVGFCRFLCSQEIMYAEDNKIKFSALKARLKEICSDSNTKRVLKTYPIWKLPIKQAVFAFAMKFRLYFAMKLIVDLRNKG